MSLHNFNADDFLKNHWQQRPLLLRQAIPDFDCPVDGNDLAGMACETLVESRLIVASGDHWELRNGPFRAKDFSKLPASGWTLLVQAVDQWIPEVTELLSHFSFLPRWRIDDIMISYAVDGGGVGPHFDQYDVFLLQGAGRRQWRLGGFCDDSTPLQSEAGLKLLQDFREEQVFTLEAGDILYVPPGFAHWGSALGNDCITLSIGFRAPSVGELLQRWSEARADTLSESQRYRDPATSPGHCAEISSTVLSEIKGLLTRQLAADQDGNWFGELMTEPRYPDLIQAPEAAFDAADWPSLVETGAIRLNPASRLAFNCGEDTIWLFVDGSGHSCPADWRPFIEQLCNLLPGETLSLAASATQYEFLRTLANQGSLLHDEDDY